MAIQTASRGATTMDHFDPLPFIALMMVVLATLLFITMTMASINLGAGAAEGWIPAEDEDSHKKVPILVEWDGETVGIQLAEDTQRIFIGNKIKQWWNGSRDLKNERLKSFLDDMIVKKGTHYVLFAVRPSGFDNFQVLASAFRQKGVSIGYEPIEQGKTVRLKLKEDIQ